MATKHPLHDFLKGSDMVVTARTHRAPACRLDRPGSATPFGGRPFKVDQILEERTAIRRRNYNDMPDEDRLRTHVADNAASLKRAAKATIDNDLGLSLPLEMEIQQLRVEKPNQ